MIIQLPGDQPADALIGNRISKLLTSLDNQVTYTSSLRILYSDHVPW